MQTAQEPPQSFVQKLQRRLAASRFFTVSLLIHAIIVFFGATMVLFEVLEEPPDFTADGGGGLVAENTSAAPPPDQPVDPTETSVAQPNAPTISAPTVTAITTTASASSFKMAASPVPVAKVDASAVNSAVASKSFARGSGTGIPSSMGGRMGGGARSAMMKQSGGKEKSEKAVMAGLRWLKEKQNEDGSWSDKNRPAMTGLALLCFLGHGELPESPEFGPTVKKAVDWLLSKGTQFEGKLSMTKDGWGGGNAGVYEHGIATYALGEYYTMSKDERVAPLLTQAVAHIVNGQAPDGGWQYSYAKGPGSDTSVAGWQIQALKAAHLTGLNLNGVDQALDKSMLNLKRVQGDKGGFGYRGPEDRYSLTGVGVLCTYFWKQDKDKVVRDGIDFLLDQTEKSKPVKYKGESADLYAWYYHTQACLMFGGTAWQKWNRWFQDEICDNQSVDGSWPVTGGKGHSENDPGIMGQTYRTTLCILMLEVFYRYMPINKA